MEIPKKIQKLLDRRERLAIDLAVISSELDEWLEKNGANLCDPDIKDSTVSGCVIYCEPWFAKKL